MIKGIDVSSWQGNIDFAKVKASGIDFVIIRAGYGRETRQNDNCFELNYRNAKAAGLDVGAYWYSYADSAEDAVKEARACMEVIKGKKFEYPIYFDLEEQSQFAKGRNFCDSVIKAFCGELEKNGYLAGLYCSTYYLNNYNELKIKLDNDDLGKAFFSFLKDGINGLRLVDFSDIHFQRQGKIAKFYFIVDRIDLASQAKAEFEARGLKVITVDSKEDFVKNIST